MPTNDLESWRGKTTSAEATINLGRAIARHARCGDLVALVGELGAGKTQLVRGLAAGLGLRSTAISSPTFVMVQEYEPDPALTPPEAAADAGPAPLLVHVDAYRLRTADDLESIGWDDRPDGELRRGALVVVEWADRLGPSLGDDALEVMLTHAGPSEREVAVRPQGAWVERWPALRHELDQVVGSAAGLGRCPMCGAVVDMNGPTAPFCSQRCRMADLYHWLGGRYAISRPIEQPDLDES